MSSPVASSEKVDSFGNTLEHKPDLKSPQSTLVDNSSVKETSRPQETPQPEPPSKPSPSAAMPPARTKTLSWQQRPTSLQGPRARPASFLEPREPARAESRSSGPASQDGETSKADIAKSLSSKDPSWFRQTADRGIGSAALRRSEQDSAENSPSQRHELHGLSSNHTTPKQEQSAFQSPEVSTAESPSFVESVQSKSSATDEGSSIVSESFTVAADSKASNQPHQAETRTIDSEPPVLNRNASALERAGSPTKGMGGFVQSAMLRRSDSMNRRWNVQTPSGISRQNSALSNASSRPGSSDRSSTQTGLPKLDETNTFKRPDSREHSSRPGSAQDASANTASKTDETGTRRAKLSDRSRGLTLSDPTARPGSPTKPVIEGLSSSPSKRWSPTKSSWLESALSKPDAPKAKPPPSSQPAWLSDLQKNRKQKQSVDLGSPTKPSAEPKVDLWGQRTKTNSQEPATNESSSTGTTPAPKPKPSRLSDGPLGTSKAQMSPLSVSEPTKSGEEDSGAVQAATPSSSEAEQKPKSPPTQITPDTTRFEQVDSKEVADSGIPETKPETPPKRDFRSQLKTRPTPPTKPQSGDLEFLNAAGKLKRTETQKYKAPDLLGDNIRRGKAGLAITGGPKPSERKDEFKESLLEQKQKMKEKAGSGTDSKPAVPPKPEPSVPEALAKRQALTRNDNTANLSGSTSPQKLRHDDQPAATKVSSSTHELSRSLSPPTVGAKLAGRFNPAIASVIARGPPSPPKEHAASPAGASLGSLARVQSAPADESAGSSQPLEHKTKTRARGPKRRAPKSLQTDSETLSAPASPRQGASPKLGGNKPAIRSSSRNVSLTLTQSE